MIHQSDLVRWQLETHRAVSALRSSTSSARCRRALASISGWEDSGKTLRAVGFGAIEGEVGVLEQLAGVGGRRAARFAMPMLMPMTI